MKIIAALLLACSTAIAPGVAAAAAVGDTLPALSLKDQYDKAHILDTTVQRIYANADRKGDELMKAIKLEQSQLDAQQAIVVAEISAAPFFVKSIIRSSLKDRRYLTWLDTKGDTQKSLPYRPNQVTVIELEQMRIKAIRYVNDLESLKKELPAVTPQEKK